jgi:hypothetical protein
MTAITIGTRPIGIPTCAARRTRHASLNRDGEVRPNHGADRVEGLTKAEGGAAEERRCDVRNQSVPRSASNALVNPVHESGGEYPRQS